MRTDFRTNGKVIDRTIEGSLEIEVREKINDILINVHTSSKSLVSIKSFEAAINQI